MDKIKSFLDYLNKKNIKKAVLLKKENINYFLEKYPPIFSVLIFEPRNERVILKVPKLEYDRALSYKNKHVDIELFEKIEDVFNGCDGVEDTLPLKYLRYIDNNYKIVSNEIYTMRMVKNNEEVDLIKKSAKISDKAIEKAMEYIESMHSLNKLVTENELVSEIEYTMKKEGSIKPSFDTIVISDRKTAQPHGIPSNKLIKNIVLMDIGAVYEGYCSDITRTVILNKENNMYNKYLEIYDIVYNAKKEVENHLREGVSVQELDTIARKTMGSYEKYFIHSLGHGVGVEVHEKPSISSKIKENMVLREGMVITIEPGIYLNNRFGIRIEDLYVVKKNGFEKLSNAKIIEYV